MPDVARALDDDGDVGVHDVTRGQQSAVQRDRLVVAAEGLPHGQGCRDPASFPEPGHGAGERDRQRTPVGHDVGDAGVRPGEPHTGEDRGQGRVQVGDDDGHPVDRVGLDQHVVVDAVLLVHREEHLLLRGVARLDDVPGGVGSVLRKAVRDGHDERQPTSSQTLEQGRGVEDHPVARLRAPDHRRVGEATHLGTGVISGSQPHGILHRSRPLTDLLDDYALAPLHHEVQAIE